MCEGSNREETLSQKTKVKKRGNLYCHRDVLIELSKPKLKGHGDGKGGGVEAGGGLAGIEKV